MKKVLMAFVVCLLAHPAVGLGAAGESPPKISMDVTEANLEDVLKLLSQQAGLNFVASEEVKEKKVTLYLDQVPVQTAIESLLEANRLVSRTASDSNLYLIHESNAPRVETITRVFILKYARVVPSAGEVMTSFGLSGSLITQTFSSSSGGSSTAGGGASLAGGAGATGGLVAIIRSLLTEHGSVVTDPRTNTLIVTEIPNRMPVIEDTIRQLDVKPIQLMIEAEVVEVTLDTLRRIGVEFGDPTAGTVASYDGPKRTSFFPYHFGLLEKGTITHTLGTMSLAEMDVLFKILATEKDVRFLARPRLLTLSNEVAEVRIVADAVTGVTSTTVSETGNITETPERNTVGTILRVTPMVNDNRYVTMVIEPEISRVIQSSSFSKFLDPNRRAARTTVMVPDGGTVMIAGLISTEDSESARRIPGLGDIPILGLPFKRTDTERKNTEILVFITPHIVREERPIQTVEAREQTPVAGREERRLTSHHKRTLKARAVEETVENILR
ncbi:MAG: type II secretion system protein GspD [Candidatus Omnitrophica bacterium]|nr:type II secretion system protein GspD [Candidatus Omnitrophota bacterium]